MKVVPIAKYTNAPAEAAPTRAFSLLRACRDKVVEQLVRALPAMMDRVDDALFDLADKAETNALQTTYFEAMREVRLKRPGMERDFKAQLVESIDRGIQRKHGAKAAGSGLPAFESDLMLVENDDLEESLAVTNMVTRIRSECKQELFALDKRMAVLLRDPELPSEANPVGPDVVCNAFRSACNSIESGIEVKLIVLKLFDRHVASEMQRIYQELNRYLVGEDVLPEIKAGIRRRAAAAPGARGGSGAVAPPGPAPSRSGVGAGAGADGGAVAGAGAAAFGDAGIAGDDAATEGISQDDLYGLLHQLMSVNSGAPGAGGTQAGAGEGGIPAGAQRATLGGLTRLQHGEFAPVFGEQPAFDARTFSSGTRNILRDLKVSQLAQDMNRFEDAIIDIVAMMFDFILDDRSIPDVMKALIGRLQIPLVKVAMLDREFFARRFHPARRLLNTLAEAAVGWGQRQEQDAGLYEVANRVVHRVLDEFVDDVSVFSEALEELENFLAEEERRAEAEAEESAEDIELRERLRLAREHVNDEIAARLGGVELPELLRTFLDRHWREMLVVTAYQAGEDGDAWGDALTTMDELIWSVLPKETAEERNALLAALPGLIRRLNRGMSQTAISDEERRGLMAELADYHAGAVRSPQHTVPAAAPKPGAPGAAAVEEGAPAPAAPAATAGEPAAEPETPETPEVAEAEPAAEALGAELRRLRESIFSANEIIFRTAAERPECSGMGTTLVSALFHDDRVSIAHVGDARLYRLRDERFEQITKDHSLVQQLIDQGFYTPEQARASGRKNVVTRALGVENDVEPGLQDQAVLPGDLYLLCSDGLSDMVEDADVHAVLSGVGEDLDGATEELVRRANDNGGKDNISVILVRVDASWAGAGADLGASLRMSSRTDVGRRRSHNEDAMGCHCASGIAVLADGMGGCNAGEVASGLAVTTILGAFGVEPMEPEAGEEVEAGEEERPEADFESGIAEHKRSLHRMFGPGVEVDEYALRAVRGESVAPESEAEAAAAADSHFEEIVIAGEGGQVQFEEPEDDQFTRQAAGLQNGAWVEFRQFDGTAIRARLAWTSPVTGKYLFTNRIGSKVAERTAHGLAVELRRGTARLLNDIPLFERAVSSITARLRTQPGLH